MRQNATLPAGVDGRGDPDPILDPVALLASPGPNGPALLSVLQALGPEETPSLVERLAYHRVDGLAWRALGGLPAAATDSWLRATLRRRHQQRAAAVLAQGLVLAEALEAFADEGIPVVVMRGLRVSEWIYRDAGSRPFEDHDLLVRPEDAAAAAAILGRLGCEPVAPGLHRRGSLAFDLHTDPIGARRRPGRARVLAIDTGALFRDARPGVVAGAPALLLQDEDDALLMAIHVVKHSFDRLVRTADLAHLVAVHGRALCWERLREKAASAGALSLVGLAFGAAEGLGVRAPAAIALPEPVRGLGGLLLRRVRALRPLPYSGEILVALAAPRLADRLAFLWDALLPGGETRAAGWRPADLPRRSVVLLDGALRAARSRRRAR